MKRTSGLRGPEVVATGFAILALGAASVVLGEKTVALKPRLDETRAERRTEPMDPRLARALSFGNVMALADALWIDVLQNSDSEKVDSSTRAKVYWNLLLISELDPLFHEAYYGGANLMTVVNDDHRGALDLLARGQGFYEDRGPRKYPRQVIDRHWSPVAWRLPMIAGYIHLFELGDMKSAAREFTHAAALPNAPIFLKQLSRRLAQPGGEYDVGLGLLNFLLLEAKDDFRRKKLEKKRRDLYLAQYLDSLSRDFRTYAPSGAGSQTQLQRKFSAFLREMRISASDPWGGRLFLDSSGRVNSTTKRERVFGLE